MEFEKIRKIRSDIISNFKSSFSQSSLKNNTPLEVILEGLIASNSFVVIIDFDTDKVLFESNLEELTGYKLEEFTVEAINNGENAKHKIIHEEDLIHKIRYDNIAYKMTGTNLKLSVLDDFYETTFRIYHKNGDILKMRRKCFFFNLDENGKPKTHIDIWEYLQHDISPFTSSRVQLKYIKNANQIFQNFYAQELGLSLTKRQKEILFFKNQAYSAKKISKKLGISEKTVHNHLDQIKTKVNDYCQTNKIDFYANSSLEILHFLKLYGLCVSN